MTGKAYLVGAGPGRADLITVRGLRLLQQADVVIYDRLIAQELLDEIHPDAERIFAGKRPHRHVMPQDQINAVLLERVRAGKQVVRLKGGDPFVFGRGGEEALALSDAGLPYEIVPGISSALAAPAFAGIPVTHRGVTTSFAVVAGYEDPTKAERMTDWSVLAHVPTLVILMGVRNAARIARALIAAGRDAETPVAAISRGTTDRQRVARATLGTLSEVMAQHNITAPAAIIVGDVAALHDRLAWFEADGQAAGFIPVGGPAQRQRQQEGPSQMDEVDPL